MVATSPAGSKVHKGWWKNIPWMAEDVEFCHFTAEENVTRVCLITGLELVDFYIITSTLRIYWRYSFISYYVIVIEHFVFLWRMRMKQMSFAFSSLSSSVVRWSEHQIQSNRISSSGFAAALKSPWILNSIFPGLDCLWKQGPFFFIILMFF